MAEVDGKAMNETLHFFNTIRKGEVSILDSFDELAARAEEPMLAAELSDLAEQHEDLVIQINNRIEEHHSIPNDEVQSEVADTAESAPPMNMSEGLKLLLNLEKSELEQCHTALSDLVLEQEAEDFVRNEVVPLKRKNIEDLTRLIRKLPSLERMRNAG